MKAAAAVILFFAFAGAALAAPRKANVVDWELAMTHTMDTYDKLEEAMDNMKTVVSGTPVEQQVVTILDSALVQCGNKLNMVANEIIVQSLTSGRTRSYFYQKEAILMHTHVALQEPLEVLVPEMVLDVETLFAAMFNEMGGQMIKIINVLAAGPVSDAPRKVNVVDWETVLVHTMEMYDHLELGVNEVKAMVHETSYEVGQQVANILDPAHVECGQVISEMANMVMDQVLTSGNARALIYELDVILMRAHTLMQEPLDILHPDMAEQVFERFDLMTTNMSKKQQAILILLANL